jgi:DnaJ-class molecular chaperone
VKTSTTLPRTTSEAYEVLGVNAEVSAGVLKKIVDALRMSWHPDHARDESDRVLRESRIRQINIAWDIINGKREAA